VTFWAAAAGYVGNNVLPARAGEIIRSLLVSRRSSLGKAFVLTTALVERIFDALALIALSGVALWRLPVRPGWMESAVWTFALTGLAGVVAILLLPAGETYWRSVLAGLPVRQTWRDRLQRLVRDVSQGVRSLYHGGRLGRFVAFTAAIWWFEGATAMLVAHAIGLSFTVGVAVLLVAGLGLGSALPATPGYVGIYQFVAVSVLTPFGLGKSDAIAYILLFQAMNYLVVLFWGVLGFGQLRRPPSGSSQDSRQACLDAFGRQ
jgi:uncharacterized protein (TIRG00374 family)